MYCKTFYLQALAAAANGSYCGFVGWPTAAAAAAALFNYCRVNIYGWWCAGCAVLWGQDTIGRDNSLQRDLMLACHSLLQSWGCLVLAWYISHAWVLSDLDISHYLTTYCHHRWMFVTMNSREIVRLQLKMGHDNSKTGSRMSVTWQLLTVTTSFICHLIIVSNIIELHCTPASVRLHTFTFTLWWRNIDSKLFKFRIYLAPPSHLAELIISNNVRWRHRI